MPVAVGRVGELVRDVRVAGLRPVDPRPVAQHLRDKVGAGHPGQEVLEHHPLVVPARGPLGLPEQRVLVDAVVAQAVHQAVVHAGQRHLELVDEQVGVLARVAHQRHRLVVAGQVMAGEQQLRRVVALVQVRVGDRPGAVQALEIGLRRAEVADLRLVGVVRERGAVGGDVVGHVLAEERPARGHARVVVGIVVAAVAPPALDAQRADRRLVPLQPRQVGEQPAIATAVRGRLVDAARRGQAVVTRRRQHAGAPRQARARRAGARAPPPCRPRRTPGPRACRPGRRRRRRGRSGRGRRG